MSEQDLSPIQRKTLKFFHENPQAVETVRGIAVWLGEEAVAAEAALEVLVKHKWLAVHESSAVKGYALTHDERVLTRIKTILESD